MVKFFQSLNWYISLPILFFLSIGILVIFSSSQQLAVQQAVFALFGIILYVTIASFDYRSLKGLINPLYVIVIAFLVLVIIVGVETRGSVRWIDLGIFNVQPSEFAKPVLILLLAKFWSTNKTSWINMLKSIIWSSPFLVLIYKQPDLGTALTILAIWVGVLWAAGISLKKFAVLVLLFLFTIPMGWFVLHDYQRDRITSFFYPTKDPLGMGYNIIQSTIAVGSGQLFGRGLGSGTQSRLQFLPEFRTDFIFASIAEEMGLLGSLLIIAGYLFILIYCLTVAQRTSDFYGFLIICGVISMLMFQTIVNIGMNVGIFPITGITLPLVSYGGSSLVATLISLGLVASISKYSQRLTEEA